MSAKWVSLCALGLSLGALAGPAAAAPLGDMKMQAGASQAGTELVTYSRCWWADGRRHCRRGVTRNYYGYDNDYYGYGYNRPGCGGYNDWRYYYYPRHY